MITLIKQKKKCKQNFRTLYRHDNFTWIFRCKITKIKKIGTCNDFWWAGNKRYILLAKFTMLNKQIKRIQGSEALFHKGLFTPIIKT